MMRGQWLAVLGVALLVAGCGARGSGAASSSVGPTTSSLPTTRGNSAQGTSSESSGASTSSGLTYSDSASFKSNNFSYTISFNVALGEVSTNTAEQQPAAANVLAPLSGSATLANNTAGYTASGGSLPAAGVFAVYPNSSPICQLKSSVVDYFDPGPQNVCALDIAELMPPCDNGSLTAQIPPDQSLAMTVWPALSTWPDNSAADMTPVNYGGALDMATVCEGLTQQPSSDFQFFGLDNAQEIASALTQPPRDWLIADESEQLVGPSPDCANSDNNNEQFVGAILSSKPSGISGCLAHDD